MQLANRNGTCFRNQSQSITDSELNEVTGGGANFQMIDTEKKMIYIVTGGIPGLGDRDYRHYMEDRYSRKINEGYILVHIGPGITWGHQVN